MNIIAIVNELRAEKAAGNEMAEEMIERVDRHIRDLEMFKAWIRDSAKARDMAMGSMLGVEPEVPQMPAVTESVEGDAA